MLSYDEEDEEHEIDDDPRCVCGVYRSEHRMMGCKDGFILPEDWEKEKQHIRERIWSEDDWGRDYDDGD